MDCMDHFRSPIAVFHDISMSSISSRRADITSRQNDSVDGSGALDGWDRALPTVG